MGHVKDCENPFESIADTIAFSSRDWGIDPRDAWVYGIAVGWKEEGAQPFPGDNDAMTELAEMHGWTPKTVARLRRLRAAYVRASRMVSDD